ncbi:histone-lysine N-methyltransferase NSD2 isoform X2 [Oncorhynchus masou masou]|uniref:histone-lysine N-methyltransferase NSD2 isoform X2 n=1 Tax=Oncorhynchus masou masou TaxID=90313 RepID=UPI0031845B7A
MDSKGRSVMDSTSKGRSLPSMPEALNPVSMNQLSEPLGGRMGRGGGDLGADPALLMDKSAAQLAVTLQDSVLNNMAAHGHNHNNHRHERLKDLTSLMLNGDQDKLPKLCHPEPPTLKGAEAPPSHPSPQRKATSPEIKLKITKMVSKGKPPHFEPCCGEGPNLPADTEGLVALASKEGRRKRRPIKLKHSSASNPVPVEVSAASQPEEDTAAPQQIQQASTLVEEEESLEEEEEESLEEEEESLEEEEESLEEEEESLEEEEESLEEQSIPVHAGFSVGDVVWTKVPGYPWWPCMVSTDPELNTHLKHKAINSRTAGVMYHVQYFGDTLERRYIFEKNMVSFRGEEQYVELCHGDKPASRVVHRKSTIPSVPRKLHAQWVVGITEAKEAASLALEERLVKYTFTHDSGGPHLNPRVLAKLYPAEPGQYPVPSRRSPLPPSPASPQADSSTSLGKKRGGPRKTDGKRKQTTFTQKKKANMVVSPKGPTQMPFQDGLSTTSETELLESQSQKRSTLRTERKRSKVVIVTTDIPETLSPAPTAIGRKERQKQQPGQQPGKRALKETEEKDQQPSKRALKETEEKDQQPGKRALKETEEKDQQPGKRALKETEEKDQQPGKQALKEPEEKDQQPGKRALKETEEKDQQPKKKPRAVAAESSAPTKKRNRKKTETHVKGFTRSESPEKEPEKIKPIRKRQDLAIQSAASQAKKRKRAAASPEPEGSGSEERPESPSDSIDQASGAKKANGGGPKKESVCQVCEQAGEDVVPCEGQCCGSFHLSCLGSTLKPQDKLLCPDCTSGVHQCFSCKLSEGEVHRCNVLHCGMFYHDACVRNNTLTVFDNKGFHCPLHTCISCHSKPKATKGKLMRCLRCPVAYHTGEVCVAAGSEMLTPTTIICTNHFSPKKGYSHHSHVNVSWCFVCSKGQYLLLCRTTVILKTAAGVQAGERVALCTRSDTVCHPVGGQLLCCESCPAAFHPDCLNIAMPDGSWFCNDCRAGKKPKYRDIIWVKLGNYRWWPAEIQHPRNIPTNIQHLRHKIGEFPVFFFGSKDYFWTHQGRVFPYMEGDRGSRVQKTGIGKVFKNALLEAENRFKEIKMEREAKETQENNRKPPPYKYIKINKPCGRVQVYTADVSEIPKCNCKPTDEKPCGFESECLNRMLMYECHPQVCPSAERCCNQEFTKRHYPETKIIKTAGKGWGLVALRDIKKGEFVNEYIGELIDEEECRSRIKYYQENDITHFYMLTIDKDRIIDAGPKGNYSRFMNHSCQPNCDTQKWTVNGDTRVGLFAVCDIPAGTELTFNYNLDCLGNEKMACRCGASNCSGFLGDRPKTSGFQAAEPKGKKAKKKVKKRRGKESEDECFRCGDGGQLVLCDRKSCTKAFHLSCLDRTKRPFGRWDCPWHHCDVCGKPSEAFCQLCPNSFCKNHQEGVLRPLPPKGQLCCQEHDHL